MTRISDRLSVAGLRFDFNRNGGNISNLEISTSSERVLHPLHKAFWVDGPDQLPSQVSLVERQLEGDFFCAPFGANPDSPIHGWTANGLWNPVELRTSGNSNSTSRSYELDQLVQGAKVTKTLTLKEGHPFLYQNHQFTGGDGHIPIAHHAMIRVPGGARLSFSQKSFGVTPQVPLETDPSRGGSLLSYPQRFDSITHVATGRGESVDISHYPFAREHEDIAVLLESSNSRLAWSAALASRDGFLFFAIKDPDILPQTLLWMSNGGRHYSPWDSKHDCVLGIEEAATSCHRSGGFASAPDKGSDGLACGLNLLQQGSTDIRYGFGAIPAPQGWSQISDIRMSADNIVIEDVSGATETLPFHGAHFGL
ncbi:MAG: hypothetical protein ACR2O8_18335 [Rhizobiaceae bacterium]